MLRTSKTDLRYGLTLIEVVVGTVIAGTLLVSILLSASTFSRQRVHLEEKREALRSIDRFLAEWSLSDFAEDSEPEEYTKPVGDPNSGDGGGRFQIAVRPRSSVGKWGVEVVRVSSIRSDGSIIAWIEILRERKPRD